jgi:predicted nucleic acid-binding protein
LLGYPNITEAESQNISALLHQMRYLPMNQAIEDVTIEIRRRYRLKTPDALIAATAKAYNLELLTLDQQLASRMSEIIISG